MSFQHVCQKTSIIYEMLRGRSVVRQSPGDGAIRHQIATLGFLPSDADNVVETSCWSTIIGY